ncbi:putative von Willebrand factor, type A [Medicago truncatula]|uniref:Putative von Willebrand factor, type A n=1 Tax=Medicago truncatula TaxID=3880 RepID=A0A396J583_MEDTR|nr:putative von Willebrand factor, type A [Medicago truncatula]
MATATTLVGPPELYTTVTATTNKTSIDQMVTNFNTLHTNQNPPMTLTENMSPTYLTTGNPCLDFFFHVVPDTPPETLLRRLQLAWSYNPLTTLKLVCNLRGVRGTGKSDREGFYAAALWFHHYHPKTLASNVPSLADFGYFKDLPEILYRLLQGTNIRKIQKEEWNQKKLAAYRKKNRKSKSKSKSKTRFGVRKFDQEQWEFKPPLVQVKPPLVKKIQNPFSVLHDYTDEDSLMSEEIAVRDAAKAAARAKRDEKRKASLLKKEKMIALDYEKKEKRIALAYEKLPKKEKKIVLAKKLVERLAAKWCPSVDSSFDRATLLCESIAKRIFPREEYEGVEEAHYAYRVRDRLRKDVLVPLRKVLELPEVFIGANRWKLIPYNRVASVAMEFYKEKFLKHDKKRFEKYLEDVKVGKTTIAAGALLPHDIIRSLGDGDGGEVAELQWTRMVDDLLKKGKMRNCLAVCDVSGSMTGIPMDVCVALGLLVSELCEEPWKGKVITFSAEPQLHVIQGDDLKSKTEFVMEMDWGMNTDFQKVFDRILDVAVNGNLKEDQMIKRIFVFSDMEFDQASANSWETDYQAITRKYREKGYGSAVPQIVFWNLRDSMATPVSATQKGVALLSGFSKNLLKLFLDNEGDISHLLTDNDGDISPVGVMEAAIAGPEYQKLVVLD